MCFIQYFFLLSYHVKHLTNTKIYLEGSDLQIGNCCSIQMFGVEAQTEKGGGKRQVEVEQSERSNVLQSNRMEAWFIKKGKKRNGWGVYQKASPLALPPEAGCSSHSDSLFLPPSLQLFFLPLHTPFDPWGSTQPLTHINYTLLQLLLAQASGWHGIHTPSLSISCIFLPPLTVPSLLSVQL